MQPEKFKIIVNMATLDVSEVSNFADLNGENRTGENQQVRHVGQHFKMPGYVLAVVSMRLGSVEMNLFHPDTSIEKSTADVIVLYTFKKGEFCLREPEVTFHQDDECLTDFTPSIEGNHSQDKLWPTGGKSLIDTTLAIEKYFWEQQQIGFPQKILKETLPLVLIGKPLMQLSM